MKRGPAFWFATWFGCGLAPFAPGTAGSLGAAAVAWVLLRYAGFTGWHFALLTLALLYPAIQASTVVARDCGRKDPGLIVIDEVLGLWLTLAGAVRMNAVGLLLAFVLFRLFDIWKPWPVRSIERLEAGAGIVLDDIGAGVYGALVLFAAGWFNLY